VCSFDQSEDRQCCYSFWISAVVSFIGNTYAGRSPGLFFPAVRAGQREASMKRISKWCLIVFVSMMSAAWSQAQMTGGTEKAVAGLEQQWLRSQKTNNPDLVAPLLADKFISTGSDGKVSDKGGALADAKASKYESMEYEDVKVTVFGDTAIATGGSKARGTDAAGKPMDNHSRWTDTWVKMPSGQWQCVASHVSTIKM
jgi:hypothetical protein